MGTWLEKLFSSDGFVPRLRCGAWSAGHARLAIIADVLIFVAYVAIPVAFGILAWRQRVRNFPHVPLLWFLVAFIAWCGVTHLVNAMMFYWPVYRLDTAARVITAGVSLATVVYLLQVLPEILALRSPREYEVALQERDAAVQALQADRTSMDALLDQSVSAVVGADMSGRVILWNRQAEVTFQWTAQEVLGRPISELLIPPEQREAHLFGLRRYLETGEGPLLRRRIELQALRKDQYSILVEARIVAISHGAGPAFYAFLRDLTADRQLEMDLRSRVATLEKMVLPPG